MSNPTVSREVGNARLLELAQILENVPKFEYVNVGLRRERRGYYQGIVLHPCGSPACAWGHWFIANFTRLTDENPGAGCVFPLPDGTESRWFGIEHSEPEFDLTPQEAFELFSTQGCKNAQTGAEAAAYIRDFVNRRQGSGK